MGMIGRPRLQVEKQGYEDEDTVDPGEENRCYQDGNNRSQGIHRLTKEGFM